MLKDGDKLLRLTLTMVAFTLNSGLTIRGRSRCNKTQYLDEQWDRCEPCRTCFKNSSYLVDQVSVMQPCKENNPNSVTRYNGRDVFLWCDHKSLDFRALPPEPAVDSTLPSTATLRVMASKDEPLEGHQSLNVIPYIAIGFIVLVVVITAVILWKKLIKKRQMRPSPPATIETSADTDSENSILMDDSSSPPHSVPSAMKITATPSITLKYDDHLVLTASPASDSTMWVHLPTSIIYFGPRVEISEVKPYHAGQYRAQDGSTHATVTISISGFSMPSDLQRPTHIKQIAERQGAPRQAIEHVHVNMYGAEPIEHGSAEPIEHGDPDTESDSIFISVEPCPPPVQHEMPCHSQPSHEQLSSHGQLPDQTAGSLVLSGQSRDYTQLVPSGQAYNTDNALSAMSYNVRLLLLHMERGDQSQGNHFIGGYHCTLSIRTLLEDEIALQQLAILVDHQSILRLLAAKLGNLNGYEINYIWECTRGSGNTVKGLFEHIIKKNTSCSAYDFASFLVTKARWQGSYDVLRLLLNAHPNRVCLKCQELLNSLPPSPSAPLDDVCARKPPGHDYHRIYEHSHCELKLEELVLSSALSEGFIQDISIYLTVDDLWRQIGSCLAGITTDALDHMRHHNRGVDLCRKMLYLFVHLYPHLRATTLIVWLNDHRRHRAAQVVLNYHDQVLEELERQCDFCRPIHQKDVV